MGQAFRRSCQSHLPICVCPLCVRATRWDKLLVRKKKRREGVGRLVKRRDAGTAMYCRADELNENDRRVGTMQDSCDVGNGNTGCSNHKIAAAEKLAPFRVLKGVCRRPGALCLSSVYNAAISLQNYWRCSEIDDTELRQTTSEECRCSCVGSPSHCSSACVEE